MLVETTALESDAAIDAGTVRWTVTLAASLGWFFGAFVITIYALTVPLIAAEFGIETTVLSGAVSSISSSATRSARSNSASAAIGSGAASCSAFR